MFARLYTTLLGYFALSYFRNVLWHKETITAWFSVIGFITLINELFNLFSSQLIADVFTTIGPWWSIAVTAAITLLFRHPKLKVRHEVRGLDAHITIEVGDLFRQKGAWIIPSNTTFDTDVSSGIIAEKSVQGQFLRKLFKGKNRDLDLKIRAALAQEPSTQLTLGQKPRGNLGKYEIGQVARVELDSRNVYFFAMADLNLALTAVTSFETLIDAVSGLWARLGNSGEYEECLAIPVVGSGIGRVPRKREEIVKLLVRSFLAASTERRFCDELKIVIRLSDYRKFGIDMDELDLFVSAACKFIEDERASAIRGQQDAAALAAQVGIPTVGALPSPEQTTGKAGA